MEYLQSIGAFEVSINKIIKKEAKGKSKPAYYIEFKTNDGRIVSTRMNRPMINFDFSKASKIISLFKPVTKQQAEKAGESKVVEFLESLCSKKLVILVSCNDYNGKMFFQANDFLDISASFYIEGGKNSEDPFNTDTSDHVGAALNAFEGSKAPDDDFNF